MARRSWIERLRAWMAAQTAYTDVPLRVDDWADARIHLILASWVYHAQPGEAAWERIWNQIESSIRGCSR